MSDYNIGGYDMSKKIEPLTESYFYILLCLFDGPNHGYGIMQKTESLSNGRVKIGSGTMYGATSNMMKKEWMCECQRSELYNENRRMYELTKLGQQILLDDYKRLEELVVNAKNIVGGR